MNSDQTSSSNAGGSAGTRWLLRLGLMLGALVVALGLAELGLRLAGFEFHLYPEKITFGYPPKEVIDEYFEQHDDYFWVTGRARKNIDAAWAETPYLILSGCSCTEWGGFGKELVERAAETPGVGDLTVANFGNSGWTSFQGLQLMEKEIVRIQPEVVTIFYGWNDHWMGFGVDDKTAAKIKSTGLQRQELRIVQFVTKALVRSGIDSSKVEGENSRPDRVALPDFRSNLERMVDLAREAGIEPVLITAPSSHVEGDEPEYLNKGFIQDLSRLVPVHQAYVRTVREVAAAKDVVLCDLEAAFAELPREELLSYMKEDGIHFTEAGGEKVGELLFRTLLENDLLPKEDG